MAKETEPTYFIADMTLQPEGRRVGFLVEDPQGRAEPASLGRELLDELIKIERPDSTSADLEEDPKFMPMSRDEFEFVRGPEFTSANIPPQTKIYRFKEMTHVS